MRGRRGDGWSLIAITKSGGRRRTGGVSAKSITPWKARVYTRECRNRPPPTPNSGQVEEVPTMNREAFSLFVFRPLLLLIAVLISVGYASAGNSPAARTDKDYQPGKVLYRFHGSGDGANPAAGLIADHAGNFYGTAEYGGVSFYGSVFELSPPGKPGGAWTETTLYSFANDGDGARPTAGLIFDQLGNLYGTTSDSNAGGYGEIFQLSPPGVQGGAWTETVLYSFTGGDDGAYPAGGVIFDPSGNLFGTTESSVFELIP